MIDTDLLDEMEEVCKAATPGKWLMHGGTDRIDAPVFDDPDANWRVATAIRDEDRKFIARARTWLPALVAELREARAEIAKLQEYGLGLVDSLHEADTKIRHLRALVPPSELRAEGLE